MIWVNRLLDWTGGAIHRRLTQGTWLALAGLALVLSSFPTRADWPEFRGPFQDGHATAPGKTKPAGLPITWSETNNVKWKTEIPFTGWSTPVVMGKQVWLTTATTDGHDFYAICVDADTGAIRFNEKIFHADNPEPLGDAISMNCYATPSPVIESGRVYVHFGSYGTACLNTRNFKTLWKRTDLPCRHFRGPSSSPIIYKDLLILTLDGVDLQYHVALNKFTGETIWKTNRTAVWHDENEQGKPMREGDLRKSHSTPVVVNAGGKPLMLCPGAKAAYGYDPRNGHELWKVSYNDYSTAPRAVFDGTRAFFITGGTLKEMWAVKVDGQGDVTETGVAWKSKSHIGRYASPLLIEGLLYVVADENYITCFEPATGQVVWAERIPGRYAASPVYADGRIYVFNQQGVGTVIKPGRAFEIIGTNSLADGFMASPAVSGKSFFLRTRTHLYRVEKLGPG